MTSRRELLRVAFGSASLAVLESAVTAPGQTGENTEKPAQWFWIPGHAFTLKAVGADTEKVFTWILAQNKPREGVVLHQHSREDECFYILDGRYEMTIGDRTTIGTSGSFFFGPRNTPHRWTNVGSTTGRLLFVYSPSGIEEFFLAVGIPVKHPDERPPLIQRDWGKSSQRWPRRLV